MSERLKRRKSCWKLSCG